ncbi:MAG: PrgI family protein [Oscillospiraceae bacterium]|jgi:hypothetical protein|nr:PrgI family protein [Oscillospiraceae bacterium]
MPYVTFHKDLTRVKTKLAFNLTKRQLICFGAGLLIGVPAYFLCRGALGNEGAVVVMMILMLPAFITALYERDGMPLEKILKHVLTARVRLRQRPYKTENIYEYLQGRTDAIERGGKARGYQAGGAGVKNGSTGAKEKR